MNHFALVKFCLYLIVDKHRDRLFLIYLFCLRLCRSRNVDRSGFRVGLCIATLHSYSSHHLPCKRNQQRWVSRENNVWDFLPICTRILSSNLKTKQMKWPSSGGVVLVVPNYTGDVLNFGLAAEWARKDGIKVSYLQAISLNSTLFLDRNERKSVAGALTARLWIAFCVEVRASRTFRHPSSELWGCSWNQM